MNISRRNILKLMSQGGLAVGAMMAAPGMALAAWAEKAFMARDAGTALQALLGTADHTASDKVKINAPDIAENGAVVPVSVSADLDGVESISILIEKNPQPLAASFDIPEGTSPEVSIRVRMGKTSNVTAVVKAGGKVYSATKETKVTIGGCGG